MGGGGGGHEAHRLRGQWAQTVNMHYILSCGEVNYRSGQACLEWRVLHSMIALAN